MIFLQYNEAISYFLGLNFRNFFLNFFADCPWLTNTVKGRKKVVSCYSGKLSNVLFKCKKCFTSSSSFDYLRRFWTFARNSPALEFKPKNVSYNHSLNKTKQPFYNLLQYFRLKVDLWKNSNKNFENYCKKITKIPHLEQVL